MDWEDFAPKFDGARQYTWGALEFHTSAVYELQIVVQHEFAKEVSDIFEADARHIGKGEKLIGEKGLGSVFILRQLRNHTSCIQISLLGYQISLGIMEFFFFFNSLNQAFSIQKKFNNV